MLIPMMAVSSFVKYSIQYSIVYIVELANKMANCNDYIGDT